MDRMLSFVFLLSLCRIGSAIKNYYLDDHCGSTLSISLYDQIRLRTTSSTFYNRNMKCAVTLKADYGNKLMVYFNGLNVEGNSPSCSNDFLEIDDGSSRSSPYIAYTKSKYCGSSYPSTVYKTTGSSLTVYFESDSFNNYYSGFDLIITQFHTGYCYSYEYECDNGRCIDNSVSCSQYNSCGDYSDCGNYAVVTVGGIAGIAVGSIIGVFVFIVIVTIVCRRRRALIVRSPVVGGAHVQTVTLTTMNQSSMAAMAPPSYNQVAQYGYNQPGYPQPTAYPGNPQPAAYPVGTAMPQPQY